MTSSTQIGWAFGPDEFAHVWDRLGADVFPYPLQVVRGGATDVQQRVLLERVRARLRAAGVLDRGGRLEPELESALRMLRAPEVSVDSVWMAEDGSDSPHRVLAVRTGRRAVIATQEPGPREHAGGDVLVRDIGISALAAAVVAELPADRAGRQPGGSWRADQADRAPVLNDLLAARRLRAGQLGVTAAGNRGAALFWFDVAGDGRYALARGARADGHVWVGLAPADPALLRDRLARLLQQTAADHSA